MRTFLMTAQRCNVKTPKNRTGTLKCMWTGCRLTCPFNGIPSLSWNFSKSPAAVTLNKSTNELTKGVQSNSLRDATNAYLASNSYWKARKPRPILTSWRIDGKLVTNVRTTYTLDDYNIGVESLVHNLLNQPSIEQNNKPKLCGLSVQRVYRNVPRATQKGSLSKGLLNSKQTQSMFIYDIKQDRQDSGFHTKLNFSSDHLKRHSK